MNNCLFLIIIFLCNIIQGITGFAGTILAMPLSIILVGFNVAKPILNILGILSGLYVFLYCYKNVKWNELKRILIIMIPGIMCGIYLKRFFIGRESYFYKTFGAFVIILAINGLYKIYKNKKINSSNKLFEFLLLILSGIIHGMFVSGGPLLIGYLSKRIEDKVSFRATISTVWIILNSIIFIDDFKGGLIIGSTIKFLIITIPFLFMGMFIGSKLYSRMSQSLFMKLTYILLIISGISLFVK